MRRRRLEVILIARAVGYGSFAIALIVTGAAGLIEGNTLGIAGLIGGAVVGAMAGLIGYAASVRLRRPAPLSVPTRGIGRFERLRLIVLAISAGLIGLVGVCAIVLGLIDAFPGRQFPGLVTAGIFFLAISLSTGTRAWARWPTELEIWRPD